MIRNIVVGRVRPGLETQLAEGLAGIAGLDLPGLVEMHVGTDAGLRDGNLSFAVTNDWIDADAYRNYDADPEHGRFRAMIAAASAELSRVQIELEPGGVRAGQPG